MMSWLCVTTLAVLLHGAPPQADRIPVDCTVSQQAGAIDPAHDAVTALICADAPPGFYVPSALYRRLQQLEIRDPYEQQELANLQAQVQLLHVAVAGLTKSASAAQDLAQLYKDAFEGAIAEDGWYEHPVFWVGVGFLGAIGVVLAVAELLPDQVISP
jgi:hypothetical protein